MNKKRAIFALNLMTIALTAVGQSTWITFDNSKSVTYQSTVKLPSDLKKVAYTIDENKAITYYLTIESALEHTTSGTVYVVPGTNPTITRDCEIKPGVTLCMPYDDNGDGTHSDYTNLENQSNDGFADKDASSVTKNRKNLVTIAKKITLTNNGTMDIAGKIGIGSGNQRPSGFALGDYCEILMQENSKIQNNGTINLYGYIKESAKDNGSSVENSSTGSIKMPFTIYDFRGGTYSSNAYTKSSMPFNYFDFPNCHVTQVFNYGSKLTGIALLYASSSYYSSEVLALATDKDDCLFKLSSGKVTLKYNPSSFGFTTADVTNNTTTSTANYTDIIVEGDLNLASFVIKVSWYTFNSASVECPICYKYQIIQKSGTLTVDNKMKFLTGSSLTIANGANCIMNAETTFYQGYAPLMTIGSKDVSPQKLGRAKLVVNGNLTINSSFGGLINTDESSGVVITGSDFVDNYISQEMIDNSNWNRHVEYAEAFKKTDTLPSTFRLVKENTYNLFGNYWTDNYTDLSSLTIDNPSGTSSNKSSATYTVNLTYDYADYSSSDLVVTWSIKPEIDLTTNGNSVTFTTPAATSESIIYILSCEVKFTRQNGDNSTMTISSGKYEAYYDDSCVLATTMVMMADGTYKEAGALNVGDEVMCFNHETGRMIPNKLIINSHIDEEPGLYDVVNLEFENNKKTSLVDEHAYFDVEENKYIYLNKDNATKYIGHRFVFIDHELKRYTLKLKHVSVEKLLTKLAAPVSAYHLNVIVDDMLSIEGGIAGLFNVFEYDRDTLAYDKESMEEDLQRYGLTDYDQFKDYFPYEVFHDFLPCKYFNVACGKGLVTWDIIKSYISKWKDQLLENM